MHPQYSKQSKKIALQKYLSRGNRSVTAIAQEMDSTSFSIYQWTKSYKKGLTVVNNTPRSPEDFSPNEKLESRMTFTSIPQIDQGEWLRKNGLTSEKIDLWKDICKKSLGQKIDNRESAGDKKEIKRLEKELLRKDKALAETATLLVLQKKIAEIYGSEDE